MVIEMKKVLLLLFIVINFISFPTLKGTKDIFEWGDFNVVVEHGEDLQIVLSKVKEKIKLKEGYFDPNFYVENNNVNYTTQSSINTKYLKVYRLDHRAVSKKYDKDEIRSYYFHVVDLTPPEVVASISYKMAYGSEKPDYKKGILVTDNVTPEKEIEVIVDESSINYNKVGKYPVLFVIRDGSGNVLFHTEYLEIVDAVKPTIAVLKPLIHQVGTPFIFDEYFLVTDNTGESVIVDYYFNETLETIGEKKINITAKDLDGNTETFSGIFNIIDSISPVITLEKEIITINLNEEFDLLSIITFSDNYDELTADDLLIISNVNNQIVGAYEVIYELSDKSNNKTTEKLIILVKDLIKPIIVADDLEVNVKDNIDFLLYASVSDNYSPREKITLKIIYNNVNFEKPGVYYVTYEAVDENGNAAHLTIDVTVIGKTNEQNTFYILLGVFVLGLIVTVTVIVIKKKKRGLNI